MAMAAVAAQLARKGRGGDTAVGHLTPGEVVVPAEVLSQPGVKDRLLFGFARSRMPMGRYTVGGGDDRRNPRTGMPEYRGGGAEGTGDPGPGGSGGGGEGPGAEDPSEGFSGPGGAADSPSRGGPTGPSGGDGGTDKPSLAERIGTHVREQVKAVREDFKAMQEQEQVPGITGIVAQVAQMAIDDMFDDTPATPEQMAAHVADREATGGGEAPQRMMAQTPVQPQLGAVDAANPLAALGDTGAEGSYWQPQAGEGNVSWLSRVNADIERARRAGRQRGGQQAQLVSHVMPGGRLG